MERSGTPRRALRALLFLPLLAGALAAPGIGIAQAAESSGAPPADAGTPRAETLDSTDKLASDAGVPQGALPALPSSSGADTGADTSQTISLDSGQPLGLRQLQSISREVDPRALIAYAQFEAAQGQRDLANWIWFPDFQTTITGAGPTPEARINGPTAEQSSTTGNPNGVDIFNLTQGTKDGLFGGEWGAAVLIQMQTTMPIYTFGKIDAGQRAAAHGVEARAQLLQGQRNQAAFDVAKAYWGYQTTRDAQKSINDMRDKLEAAKKQADDLLADKSDQITASDAARLDYITDEVQAQSDAAVAQQRLAEAALKLLVGRMPEQPLSVMRETVPPPPQMPELEMLLRKARESRPDLRAAAENVEARAALLDLEKAKYYPDLAIVGGFTYSDTSNASEPDSPFVYDPYHQFSGYVALALRGTFDIPQKMARVKQVEAQLHEAIATQTGAERLVRLEIEQALADLASARGRAVHYVSGSAKTKKLLTKGYLALESGLGQAFDLLVDSLLYSRAEGERLKALLDAQVAWAALERAVGGELVQVPTPMTPDAAKSSETSSAAPAGDKASDSAGDTKSSEHPSSRKSSESSQKSSDTSPSKEGKKP